MVFEKLPQLAGIEQPPAVFRQAVGLPGSRYVRPVGGGAVGVFRTCVEITQPREEWSQHENT
jgi:hypothetical protein